MPQNSINNTSNILHGIFQHTQYRKMRHPLKERSHLLKLALTILMNGNNIKTTSIRNIRSLQFY